MLQIDIWCARYCVFNPSRGAISCVIDMRMPNGDTKTHEAAIYIGDINNLYKCNALALLLGLQSVKAEYRKLGKTMLHGPPGKSHRVVLRKSNGDWAMNAKKHLGLINKVRLLFSEYSNIEAVEAHHTTRKYKQCIKLAKKVINERS